MAKHFQRLWIDVKSTNDEVEAVRALAEIVTEKAGRLFVSQFDREDAEYCIDILGRGITGNYLETTVKKQGFYVTLGWLAGTHGRLPDSMVITENIKVEEKIVATGVFADVRRGEYMGHLVAVKTLRTAGVDNIPKIRKQFCKGVVLWNTLSHPHVLKLMGVYGDIDKGQFISVSEWMANGNIMEYIKKNHANRLELLYGAAQGLTYIHDVGLTHGHLKGANILMSNDKPPRACLADFGLMTIVLDPHTPMACSRQLGGGTVPFMPPELLVPSRFGIENPVPTPEADVYGIGMVIFQVLTGEIPFRRLRQAELVFSVVQGLRPGKPANASTIGLSESLWNFVQRCWDQDRYSRPKIADVVEHLARATANWHGVMPPCSVVENATPASEEATSNTMQHAGIYGRAPVFNDENGIFQALANQRGRVFISHFDRENVDYDVHVLLGQRPWGRPEFEPSGKTKNRVFGSSSLGPQPAADGQRQPPRVPNPTPLSVDEIIAESRRQPNQALIDVVDKMLENTVRDRDRRELLNALCKMCSRQRKLPKSMQMHDCLGGELVEMDSGGQATIFKGEYRGRPVAFKVRRLCQSDDIDKHLSEFCREAAAWRHLRHPNILPLLGVDVEPDRFAMICDWMDYGNIVEFVAEHEDINRVQLLADAANGLEYMHSFHMVHGDLKGANILINKSSRACLADFGLSTVVGVPRRAATDISFFRMASQESLMSFTPGGTVRWMSPELLDPEKFGKPDDRPTKESDCYGLGMVVYEVLCGKYPYWEIASGALVMHAILNGEQPQKPEAPESLGFTDELWGIIEQCWSVNTGTRPDVRTILSHLNHATWSWERRQLV